jgi:hypothetical protein
MGRERGVRDTQTRAGDLVIADQVQSTRHVRHMGTLCIAYHSVDTAFGALCHARGSGESCHQA